jgi:hypothetical protein
MSREAEAFWMMTMVAVLAIVGMLILHFQRAC